MGDMVDAKITEINYETKRVSLSIRALLDPVLDEEPVVGLMTADDSRQSYYLDDEENKYIYCHDRMEKDGCYFISTDMRMEYVDNVERKIKELSSDSWNNQTGDLVIFTHEWALNLETKEKVGKMCKYAVDNGYKFVFYEDFLK